MVPGAQVFLTPDFCSPLGVWHWRRRVISLVTVWGWVAVPWGVGQLADRPAVNREVGGSSPPAPARRLKKSPVVCGHLPPRVHAHGWRAQEFSESRPAPVPS